jgi:hypothetical protein
LAVLGEGCRGVLFIQGAFLFSHQPSAISRQVKAYAESSDLCRPAVFFIINRPPRFADQLAVTGFT